jgi:O-antigen/teichoic acid export membrane protein
VPVSALPEAAPARPGSAAARLNRLLPRGRLARSIALLAGSTAVGQGVVIAASPLLTRLYTPGEMGLLAVYMSIVLLLMPVASGRYDLAVPLPRRSVTAANLLAVSLLFAVCLSAALALASLAFGRPLLRALGSPELGPHLWLVPLGLLAAACYQSVSAWAVRVGEFGRLARTRLSQAVLMVLVQVAGGALGGGAAVLLMGDALGRAGGTGGLARLAWSRDRASLSRVRWRHMRAAAHRYRHFPMLSSGSALLNTAGLQLPALLFAAFYGPQVAGWLILGQRVIGIPSRLVGQAIGQVYMGEAARLAREAPAQMLPLFNRLMRRLLLVGGVPVVLVGLAAPPLFGTVFGDAWHPAGVYVRLLTPMFVAQIVVSPLSQSAALLERQGVQLVADALRTAAVLAAVVVPSLLGWSAAASVAAYSVCMLITYLGYLQMYRQLLRGVSAPAAPPAAPSPAGARA